MTSGASRTPGEPSDRPARRGAWERRRGERPARQGARRRCHPLAALAAWILLLLAALPDSATGQGFLEQFSYEGIRLSGLGLEMGAVVSDRLTREPSPALRIDYGQVAPRVRVLVGASYFRGQLNAEEVSKFERRLSALVRDPTGDFSISVGRITWSELEADLDLQYQFPAGRVRTYLGLGLGIHLRDGDGPAIAGTFVEDALDTIAAGLELSLGAEIPLGARVALTAGGRGSLTSALRTAAARGGLMWRFGTGSR